MIRQLGNSGGALVEAHGNGVTNAFMEGLNSVFSATKRKARDYRSKTHFITMLYTSPGSSASPKSNSAKIHQKQRRTFHVQVNGW